MDTNTQVLLAINDAVTSVGVRLDSSASSSYDSQWFLSGVLCVLVVILAASLVFQVRGRS